MISGTRESSSRTGFVPTLAGIFGGKLATWMRERAEARKRGHLHNASKKANRRAMRFEMLEPRLLLSADTIVAGLTDSLEDGLAGNPDDGFGDALQAFIDNESSFDNHVPGVRFDDVETGDANPIVREALELDIDQDGDGVRITDNTFVKPLLIGVLNLSPDIDIDGVNDVRGISAALPFISSAWSGDAASDREIALTLIDQDGSGRASLAELFEVLVGGRIAHFLESFPSLKTVADGPDLNTDPDIALTTFSDLINGYSDFGGPFHQGFTSFLSGLSEPFILGSLVDLSTSSVTNTSDADFFSYDVIFNLTLKDDYLIDLGIAAETLEIDLPAESFVPPGTDFNPYVKVPGSMELPFSFSVTRDGSADFSFSVTDDVHFEVGVNESLAGRTVNVGFLGMVGAGGSLFELSLPFDVVLTDPSSPVHLGFGQTDFAAGGDGEIAFTGGVIEATFAVDRDDVVLDQDVIFSLAFGQNLASPIEVTVTAASTSDNLDSDPTDAQARQNLVDDINDALAAPGTDLAGIITASLNGDKIRLTLASTDATELGFAAQENFANAVPLVADNALDFLTGDFVLAGAVLFSLNGGTPRLVNLSTVAATSNNDAVNDENERRTSFALSLQAALNAVGLTTVTASVTAADKVSVDPGTDSIEITRSVIVSAEFEITAEELAEASYINLFTCIPDSVNDHFEIDLTLNAKPGIVVDGGGTLNGENINITADVIVDSAGTITFPLEADLAEDFTGLMRFHLGDFLELSGTPFGSFDPNTDSFQKLLDFNVIGAAEVVNLIGQLKGWLDRLPNTTMLGGFDIPFAEATLGQLLDYADLIQDKLLLDDNDNGLEAFDDPELDDIGRLIDFIPSLDPGIRSVTFATAQELAARLDALPFVTVAGATAHYYLNPGDANDPKNRELTYDIRVETDIFDDPTVITAPIDFELDLAPVFDVSAQADVVLAGSVAFEATLGISLNASGKITFTTPLEDLNNGDGVPIRTNLAITGAEDVTRVFGRLSADATFSVTIPGVNGGNPLEVKITKSATGNNLSTADLLLDINAALVVADSNPDPMVTAPVDISGKLEAVEIGGRTVLQAIDPSVTGFQVFAASNNPAFTELGLQSSVASTVFLTGVEIDASSLSGSASFKIEVDNDGNEYTVMLSDLSGNNTLNDLVNDVNAALLAALPSTWDNKIVASRSGNRIVLAAVDGSVDVFRIADGTDTEKLGLASTQLTDVQKDSVFLSQVAGVFVIGANFLDVSVNPAATVDSAFGRLSANQSFDVSLNDGAFTGTVTVSAAATTANKEISDLVEQINAAIGGSLAGKIKAVQLSASQIGLRAIDDSVIKIDITSSASELGLLDVPEQTADGPLRVSASKSVPFYFGPSDDATFTIDYTDGGGAHSQGVTLFKSQVLTNRFIYDLVADVNQALNNAFGGAGSNPFAADFDGKRLVIRAKDGFGITAFGISADTTDETVTDLKLRDFELDLGATQTVDADHADLLIYTQDGAVHRVALNDDGTLFTKVSTGVFIANDIQEVIDAIEDATHNGLTSDVTVALNALMTGLDLTDHTAAAPAPTPIFRVESVNASRAVFGLGIQGADNRSLLADIGTLPVTVGSTEIDHVIEGDEVATLDLEDRLFMRQINADTPFLTATVDMFVVLDDGDDVGEEESAAYGFVGIELDTANIFDVLEFDVAIELNKAGDPLNNVTLAELVDAVSKDVNGDGVLDVFDLHEVVTFPTMSVDSSLDELVFDVALLPGLAPGTIDFGTTPQITLHVHDAGDPFNMVAGTAPFDGSSALVVDLSANTITLTGHGFDTGDKVSYRDFDGTSIGGLVDKQSYFVIKVDDNTIKLAKTLSGALTVPPVAVDLTSLGTGTSHRLLRFDPDAPDVHVHESDLGDLSNFAGIEFDHVLAALEQLRDFLNEFADLGFLGQEIPVLGVSFNDLIDVAGRFSDAVDDLTNNPAGTIQQLEQKIRESFGLPPGTGIIGLQLVDDLDTESTADSHDMLKVSLDLSRAFTEVLTIDLDLTSQLPTAVTDLFPDLSLLGRAGLGAAIEIIAKFSVGIDLDDDDGDDTDPTDAMGEVFLFTHEDDTSIAFTLDATSTDITFNASLGPLGVAIIGGDGKFDLDVGFKDDDALSGDMVSISDPTAVITAFGAFEPALTGSLVINLPVYFPTPSDFVGDILFDASLALSGTDLDLTVNDFQMPTDFLSAGFFENFGILTSLPLAIDALDLLLETVQDIMSGQLFGVPLPFIGDRLADGAEFIEDLRASVIAPFKNLVENTTLTDEALADLIQQFLFAILGPGGSAFPSIPELSSLSGLNFLIDPLDGLAATAADVAHLDDIIDIAVELENSIVEWNFQVGDTYSPSLDFPFDLGFPGLGLEMEGGLGVELSWNFGLGFGISTEDGPFINIDRRDASDNPIPELSLSVDAGFQPGSALVGTLGFLQFSATASNTDVDGNGIDDLNHVHADFTVDLINSSNTSDAHLSFFELGDLDAAVGVSAGAQLDLALRLGFNEDLLPDVISAIMPALVADFIFDWGVSVSSPAILGSGFDFDLAGGLNVIKFEDIGLDLGSFLGDFLGPIVAQIQEFTEPLQPIIEILTAPIPVVSDLAGKPVSLIDIASAVGEFDPGLIYALADLVTFVNSIPADPGSIILPIEDEFILVGSGLFGTPELKAKLADPTFKFADAVNPESNSFIAGLADGFDSLVTDLDGMFNEAGEFVEGVFTSALDAFEPGSSSSGAATSTAGLFGGDFSSDERGGFAFPFLENPTSILGALLGNPIVLVTYDLPPLVVEFSYEQSFPIYGPLWGVIGAGLGVRIDLAFGYDSLGVQRFAEGGFENPLDLLSGLFISDTDHPDGSGTDVPELQLKGEISVGAELNAGVASAGVQAAIILTVNFDLNDPDSDGRVRIDELVGNFLYELREGTPVLAPLAIFDIDGEIAFQLRAYLKILFAKFTFEITPPITLFEFSVDFDREPILATERGDGSLLLNIGPNAGARLHGNTDDSAETIHVEMDGDDLLVWSDQFGVPESAAQTYSGTSVVGFGGEFNDLIVIDSSVTVPVFLDGGSGDDTITAEGSGGGELSGGVGDDEITGGSGVETIFGNEGNDFIDGAGDDDLVFGDDGRISDSLIAVLIRDKDGDDTITGGAGNDTIFGAGGEDVIGGDGVPTALDDGTGDDLIFGDGGRIVFKCDIDGDGDLDTLSTPEIRSTDSAGGESDIINAHGGLDTAYGGAGDDSIDGGAGNDALYGESGFDYISGAGDADMISGGTENDVIFGFRESFNAADPGNNASPDGGDTIYGDTGNDFIRGNNGDDTIFGGRGTDIIFGDFGADTIAGEADNDYIFGGADSDTSIEGGAGNDIVFGDDGVVVFIDFGSLPFAGSFVGRLGHEIVGNHRLIGDGAFNPADAYISSDDGDFRTLDVIQTEVDGVTDGDDYVVGGEGDDIVLGGSRDDTIFGDFDPVDPPDGPIPADEDILIGDGGRIEFYQRERNNIRSIVGTAANEVGEDTISGNGGNDVLFGNGDDDYLYGRMNATFNGNSALEEDSNVRDDDIIISDDGEIDYEAGTGIIQTIFTYFNAGAIAVGGVDHAYGNKHDDIIFGGIAGDFLKGDDGLDGDDVMLGDNGAILFGLDDDGVTTMIARIMTTDVAEASGGPDTIEGQDDDDVILGGVNNGGVDLLYGDRVTPTSGSIAADGQDIILGDNGILRFDVDADLDTLDLISSERLNLGGADVISGNAGDDVLIGSTGGDTMYGDDDDASAGASDGEDIMLGDNGDIIFLGTVGRLLVAVAGRETTSAVDLITTTDTAENTGGADTMSGNARADIMLGGVNNGGQDTMYGDRSVPNGTTIANDGDDIMLGDNGLLDFTFGSDTDRNTLDLIRSKEDALGGTDVISGNKGLDVAIGGTGGDTIYGDDASFSAGANDDGDLLLGDNADVFLVAAPAGPLPAVSDLKLVLRPASPDPLKPPSAVKTIRTTDTVSPLTTGGIDTISGNARGDIIAGGVFGDTLYGDRQTPTPTTSANDGDDVILGDNGAFEWLSTGRLSEILGIDIEANNPALYAKYNPGIADTDLTTLDLITTEQPTSGGRDTIFGDEGDDVVFGGTDVDTIHGDDGDELVEVEGSLNRDLLFGDHGRLYPQFSTLKDPLEHWQEALNSRNFFAIHTGDAQGGQGDLMWGEEGDDVMLGQQGDDRMWGGSADDDMIGGHNVSGGYDELTAPAIVATLNPAVNDLMDGGSGDDAMAGDNATIWRRGDDVSPRFRQLTEATIYTTDAVSVTANIGATHESDPDDAVGRDITLLDHSDAVEATPLGRFGDDVMAGGADSDVMYGELGDDLMQGDGMISSSPDVDDVPPFISRTLDVDDSGSDPDTDETLYFNIPELDSDADDYMEGNGGDDLMYGGLGQDDMIGGSSALFGLVTEVMRPDGSDIIFGGAGNPVRLERNDFVGLTDTDVGINEDTGALPTDDDPSIALEDRHARDADFIMGDNANVYRLVEGGASGTDPDDPLDLFLTFNYDNYTYDPNTDTYGLRIIPRAMEQLDYTLGGGDFAGGGYNDDGQATPTDEPIDNGLADLIHGESGDDHIFGMTGSDVIFGNSDDDDIVGGYGHDWISGGTGQDGVLGDDGLIYTSRNSTLGEPLYGIAGFLVNNNQTDTKNIDGDVLDEVISTPGDIHIAMINVSGELKKTVDLTPFSFDPDWGWQDDEFPGNQDDSPFADDIIFGGLDSDFLHGGSGDDAISGAEALEIAYVPVYDMDGDPIGVLDLGYDAFALPDPVNPGDVGLFDLNPGDVLAFNPEDEDGQHPQNRFRAGEFALYDEYDPRRTIQLILTTDDPIDKPIGSLYKGQSGVTFGEFLLNFDESEGVWHDGGTTGGPHGIDYDPVNDDGRDVIFGDLANDWLVGGTGRDDMYGGWGNDLLNADDDHDTNGDLNDIPDTHPDYEDRAYGGAGRDVLIANTGGDRLIDWVGEYNSYLVPFAPFGEATVTRTLQPFLPEYLYALSASDGADPTRVADTGEDPLRNGEPAGEMGLVLQMDFAWQDQTGAPSDPQPGNIPGGQRDVLRSADFSGGNTQGFAIDSGTWTVSSGRYQVAPTTIGGDALAVWNHDQYLPSYFELTATISGIKPVAGYKANAFILFDYVSDTDFKFAGLDIALNKLVMGHHDASGWVVDVQAPVTGSLRSGVSYDVLLAINGTTTTLVLNGQSLTYAFAPRIDVYGIAHNFNDGMVGLGAENAKATIDNVRVQVVPPAITLTATDSFSTDATLVTAETGTWSLSNGRFIGEALAGQIALATGDLTVGAAYLLQLETKLSTSATGGVIFDQYAADDFKWAAIDKASGKVLIGHYTASKGWVVDASVARSLGGGDITLTATLKGSTVSVLINGQAALSYVFNSVVTDGSFGLLARNGSASFDSFTVRTDDPAFDGEPEGMALMAAAAGADGDAPTLEASAIDAVAQEAIARWAGDPSLLAGLTFRVEDLPGLMLAQADGSTITFDVDAAGHGWFIDASLSDDSEFRIRQGDDGRAATPNSDAFGRMDLLTVVTHELGHVLGFDHDDAMTFSVMDDDLEAGVRYVLADGSGPDLAETPPAAEGWPDVPVGGRPLLDFGDWTWDDGGTGPGAAGWADAWIASNGEQPAVRTIDWGGNSGWNSHSPFQGSKPGKGGSPNVSEFLLRFAGREGGARPQI